NTVRFVDVYSNVGLGIDLAEDGVATGAPAGSTTGPNLLQNYPTLTSAVTDPASVTLAGVLTSTPNTTFTILFFASAAADPTGFGEGQVFLGSLANVATDATGTTSSPFSVTLPTQSHIDTTQVITAIAIDNLGNSSE